MFRMKKKPLKSNEQPDNSSTEPLKEPSKPTPPTEPPTHHTKELTEIEHDLAKLTSPQEDTTAVSQELSELEQEILDESKNISQDHQSFALRPAPASSATNPASFSVLDVTRKISPKIKEILPLWIEKPIYWITPNKHFPARYTQWLEEWGHVLLLYMTATHSYVIALRDLVNEFPFKNPLVDKTLTLDQLILGTDYLETRKKLQYLDPKKTRVLVYWQSVDETADELFVWALRTGHEYLSLLELVENDLWKTLPEEQLTIVFQILIRKRKAIWADQKEQKILHFEFPT